MAERTAEEIATIFTNAGDSVTVINTLAALSSLTDEQKEEIDNLLVKDNEIKNLMHNTFDENYFTTGDWDGSNDKYNAAITRLNEETDWEGSGLTSDEIEKVQ